MIKILARDDNRDSLIIIKMLLYSALHDTAISNIFRL